MTKMLDVDGILKIWSLAFVNHILTMMPLGIEGEGYQTK